MSEKEVSSPSITAVILVKNEELMLANCIETLRWCREILVVDTGSTDQSIEMAEKLGAKVVHCGEASFAKKRSFALEHVRTDWLFYIDADERVVPQLAKEVLVQIETTTSNALSMHRLNMMYGKFFHHGGWGEEHFTRVFRRSSLRGWTGDIHESPLFNGEVTELHTSLIHLTHRNTVDGLQKTISWTPIEARLLFEGNTAPVTFMTLVRKTVMEFIRRAVLKNGRKDGMEGLIEAGIQAMNRFLVYVQLWELQQQPSIPEKYHAKEFEYMKMWKKMQLEELSPVFKGEEDDTPPVKPIVIEESL